MHHDSAAIRLPSKKSEPIPVRDRQVAKRDGRSVAFDSAKIVRAISLSFYDVGNNGAPNPHREDPEGRYGLDGDDFAKANAITQRVCQMLELYYRWGRTPSVEEVQDTIEKAIAAEGEWAVARSYMLYRERKAEMRIHSYEQSGMEDYIAVAKYARYRAELGRRETFAEAVERVATMHLGKFAPQGSGQPFGEILAALISEEEIDGELAHRVGRMFEQRDLPAVIREAFEAVKEKRVLPSMRSLQFGGPAIEQAHARMFNCSFSPVDRVEFFREYFYLLLAGTGCGFSVQKHHIERLPPLPERPGEMDLEVLHCTVVDTIEGWADALHELVLSFLRGYKVEYNFSAIRPRGSALKTSGGRAPGHLPLKRSLAAVEKILAAAAGRRLKPVEAYDICMHVAKAVLSGGIRRSATICLFSHDDVDMMSAKTGNWFEANPQRSASNNSAVILRHQATWAEFRHLFEKQKEFGEPGFYFSSSINYGCNPCCEIGLNPVIEGDLTEEDVSRLWQLGYDEDPRLRDRLSGWQMCNLSTVNAAAVSSEEEFYQACFYASVIGTLQASYTNIPYLGPVTQFINEREALLGVSICGILDNPEIFLNPAILQRAAAICKATNAAMARQIGIKRAARVTCVKPEGTASLLLGAGSGIHPHHAKRYFRRVQANRKEPIYQHFKRSNPHMTEPSVYNPDTDDVITFPVEAPETAVLRDEIGAVQFLEFVKLVQKHWVQAGCADDRHAPGLAHNVSNTCTVKPTEWEAVAEFIWSNREYFTGVSLLPSSGDKLYAQAPREEVVTEDDIAKWNRLRYRPVDYTQLREETDQTALKDVVACAGGACELI
jgi:ribonucleoside-triphosphate reductase (thioredoxin)